MNSTMSWWLNLTLKKKSSLVLENSQGSQYEKTWKPQHKTASWREMPLRTPLGKEIKQHLPTNISLAPSTSLSWGQGPKTPSFAQQRCKWSQHNANSNLSFKFNLHFLLAPLSSPHIWNKFSLFNEGRVMSFCKGRREEAINILTYSYRVGGGVKSGSWCINFN